MEVTVLEAIGRMLRATMQAPGSVLYVLCGERAEVFLRAGGTEKRIMQGSPKVFEQLHARLLGMANLPGEDAAMTREGRILYLVDGGMHPFLLRETRSLLEPNAYLLTLCSLSEL